MDDRLYTEPPSQRLPKAPIGRRVLAAGIDFLLAWMLSSVAMSNQGGLQVGQLFTFLIVWLLLRIVVVVKNRGQSPGHWALDMKVLMAYSPRLPGLQDLMKRETAVGLEGVLLLVGLNTLGLGAVVLAVPLIIDAGAALADPMERQTLHDQWAQTVVIYTQRGFSLDLKLRKLIVQSRQRMP